MLMVSVTKPRTQSLKFIQYRRLRWPPLPAGNEEVAYGRSPRLINKQLGLLVFLFILWQINDDDGDYKEKNITGNCKK